MSVRVRIHRVSSQETSFAQKRDLSWLFLELNGPRRLSPGVACRCCLNMDMKLILEPRGNHVPPA